MLGLMALHAPDPSRVSPFQPTADDSGLWDAGWLADGAAGGEIRMVDGVAVDRGHPQPYGPYPTPRGINFSLFSRHATAATLLLYRDDNSPAFAEIPLDPNINRTGNVWHIRCRVSRQVRYHWRLDGPSDSHNRFDAAANLLDPYARALSGGETWGSPDIAREGGEEASGAIRPRRSRISPGEYDWEGDRRPQTPLEDTIIYELHVRGYTIDPSSGAAQPGTFAGLTEKIPHLLELGVTAVELMPVFEFDEKENFRRNPETGKPLLNYWGYSPLAFFSPKNSYASRPANAGAIAEFRDMVKAFHRAGLEVILDVVFNHTAEGDERGPTLSFRGLDNQVYYMLDAQGRYRNFSGCGNTFNCNHPLVRTMIVDVLHYWVAFMHVDGFRFDLASILGRGVDGEVLANPPLLERIALDPVLADAKIIAEAWDAGGLNQVGRFPSYGRWAEWNGYYRDDIRRFWRGDAGMVSAAASRICGSDDLYFASGRRPNHSINFITAHDGFTMRDLVSYSRKRNQANAENNQDGENHNHSRDFGAEGPSDNPAIEARRMRQIRNFAATLLLSQGTPMILGGDEFGRTQQGNNNAYCQDNEISWVDWSLLRGHADLLRFWRGMVAFRRRHAVLRRTRFFGGTEDIRWLGTNGKPDWSHEARHLAFLLPGAPHGDADLLIAMNAGDRPFRVALPERGPGWRKAVDTSLPPPDDICLDENQAPALEHGAREMDVPPHSLVALVSPGGIV